MEGCAAAADAAEPYGRFAWGGNGRRGGEKGEKYFGWEGGWGEDMGWHVEGFNHQYGGCW